MADYDKTEFSKAIAAIIATAWTDPKFRDELVKAASNPGDVLARMGLKLPSIPEAPDAKLIFVANTANTRYIVIPMPPKLTDDDVSLFIKLRQLETTCTDCFDDSRSELSHIVDDVKKLLGFKKEDE